MRKQVLIVMEKQSATVKEKDVGIEVG